MDISYTQDSLPILHTCDVVVIGASFAGISTALKMVEQGCRITIVEPRTYPGREITATRRPWLTVDDLDAMPDIVRSSLEVAGKKRKDNEYAFNLDTLKIHLEDLLLARDVKILYASLVVDIETVDNNVQGVIIGNKSGRQCIGCSLIVDTSETALTARLVGDDFETSSSSHQSFKRTLEFDNIASTLDLDQPIAFGEQQTIFHAGYRDRGHVFVECTLTLPAGAENGFDFSARETLARHQTMDFASQLVNQVPAFESAYLSGASYELYGTHTCRLLSDCRQSNLQDVADSLDTEVPILARDLASYVRGLWYLNEAVSLEHESQDAFYDPIFVSRLGESLGRFLGEHWETIQAQKLDSPAQIPPRLHPYKSVSRIVHSAVILFTDNQ